MAQYARFEIYLPIIYYTREVDAGGREHRTVHSIDPILLNQFVQETVQFYGGITQASPLIPELYKGWWQKDRDNPLYVDRLTYLFGLVRIDQTDDAISFFERWKQTFEDRLSQRLILVVYYPVQTLGEFF